MCVCWCFQCSKQQTNINCCCCCCCWQSQHEASSAGCCVCRFVRAADTVAWLNVTASPPASAAACNSPFLWMKFCCVCVCVWRRFNSSACANNTQTETETGIHTYIRTYICIYTAMCGFFHEWNSNSMYFSLAWRCRLPNTHTYTHTPTPITPTPRRTQICCFMNDYQEQQQQQQQQLNFRCALLITSFLRLPFFLFLRLFLDNTNVVSINVRAPISRKVNAAAACSWMDKRLHRSLYLAVALSPSLSICLTVITV